MSLFERLEAILDHLRTDGGDEYALQQEVQSLVYDLAIALNRQATKTQSPNVMRQILINLVLLGQFQMASQLVGHYSLLLGPEPNERDDVFNYLISELNEIQTSARDLSKKLSEER